MSSASRPDEAATAIPLKKIKIAGSSSSSPIAKQKAVREDELLPISVTRRISNDDVLGEDIDVEDVEMSVDSKRALQLFTVRCLPDLTSSSSTMKKTKKEKKRYEDGHPEEEDDIDGDNDGDNDDDDDRRFAAASKSKMKGTTAEFDERIPRSDGKVVKSIKEKSASKYSVGKDERKNEASGKGKELRI